MPIPLPLEIAAGSDVGRVRRHNEDAYLVEHDLGLFAVADGVGGHGGGAEASLLTVTELPKLLRTKLEMDANKEMSDPEIQALLDGSLDVVNAQVYAAGAAMISNARMGTTLTGGIFLDSGNAMIFNVGDSRTYRYRNEELECVTKDQSWYQSWLDAGRIGPAPPRNVILQGIGLDESVVPDWVVTDCQVNDLWLMCSDGLSDKLSDAALTEIFKQHQIEKRSLDTLCDTFIAAANDAGGDDNITVLLLQPKPSKPTTT